MDDPITSKHLEASRIHTFLLAIELERIKNMYIDREKECDQLEVGIQANLLLKKLERNCQAKIQTTYAKK
jgi:hypothetical protein